MIFLYSLAGIVHSTRHLRGFDIDTNPVNVSDAANFVLADGLITLIWFKLNNSTYIFAIKPIFAP
ncbi:hypothetical protein B5P45_22470 [Phyllobacterium zundukense]|uniref:Uncharacterized protein n=1 Tax=Phyllobacterium zundukense TaxID=1867719 RepID=A0A2N9VQS8_9HYPH|nr:hypothetical protein BLM14_12030 [Phyllobacterium zundukense]PIO41846.1 hypothetical protein B5P45_22470 [Phyllobacterium zundukense]